MRLDDLRADLVFGWRQINARRTASAAAILSLGLAIGATTAAFRLVDALLLRPLPVSDRDRLFVVATTFIDAEKRPELRDDFDYPTYREYSRIIAGSADAMVVGSTARQPIVIGTGDEPEPAFRQFVSGNVFGTLGLQPTAGRLLTPDDDVAPGGHPVAVISHDFWTRRFARDPAAVGTRFRAGAQQYEIVGVGPRGFTGTEPGTVTDLFVPAMMNAQAINSTGWSWFRMWVKPKPGVSPEQVRQMLQRRGEEVRLLPAGSGVSGTQKTFRRPLLILSGLAVLVLLIACANVANLMTAQALARTREMALRMSIGAGRGRLIRLVLAESALLAGCASIAGMIFASWSAPLVVSMLAPIDRPVRLVLDFDWRALAFGSALALSVPALFGLAPAVRASSVKPMDALKGAQATPARRRVAHGLVAAQMALCVFLVFSAGLFVATFDRLVKEPLGFTHQNVMLVQVEGRTRQPADAWTEVRDRLQQLPGVDAVAVAGWAPLTGNRWRASVQVGGEPLPPNSPYFVSVSPAYFSTMRIAMLQGRDFRPGDAQPRMSKEAPVVDGVGVVNEAFARAYFNGQNPVGRRVTVRQNNDLASVMEIIGLVRDAAYDSVRDPKRPTVYVPLEPRNNAALLVRTSGAPAGIAQILRREVPRARPELRVRAVEPFSAFVAQQMIRERLLATLSGFFAMVALGLAGVGLYGMLNYAVIRRRREIGIRMALGARAAHVVRHVTLRMLVMAGIGSAAGLAGGIAFGRVVEALLFQVKPTDTASMALPLAALATAAMLAALPPALRAVRIDPAQTLRME